MAVLLLGLLHSIAVTLHRSDLNLDVGYNVTAAQTILELGETGRHIVDPNPPWIRYVSVVPVLLSRWTGLDIARSAHVAMLLFTVLTLMLAYRVVRSLPEQRRYGIGLAVLAAWSYLNVYIVTTPNYAQREHLVILSQLPYILLIWVRWQGGRVGRGTALTVGLLAAFGGLIKPFYVLVPLLLEGYSWLVFGKRARHMRPEFLSFLVIVLMGYLMYVVVPGWSDYPLIWIPLLWEYYDAFGMSMHAALRQVAGRAEVHLLLLGLFSAGAVSWFVQEDWKRNIVLAVLIVLPVYVLAVIVQAKLWSNHLLPIWIAGMTALIFAPYSMLSAFRDRVPSGLLFIPVVLVLLQLGRAGNIPLQMLKDPFPAPETELSRAIERHSDEGDTVVLLSLVVPPEYSSIPYAGRPSGSRYLTAFPVYMAYGNLDHMQISGERLRMADMYYRALLEDIRMNRPALLILDRVVVWKTDPRFTMERFLRDRGFFEEEGKVYEMVERVGRMDVYVRAQCTE